MASLTAGAADAMAALREARDAHATLAADMAAARAALDATRGDAEALLNDNQHLRELFRGAQIDLARARDDAERATLLARLGLREAPVCAQATPELATVAAAAAAASLELTEARGAAAALAPEENGGAEAAAAPTPAAVNVGAGADRVAAIGTLGLRSAAILARAEAASRERGDILAALKQALAETVEGAESDALIHLINRVAGIQVLAGDGDTAVALQRRDELAAVAAEVAAAPPAGEDGAAVRAAEVILPRVEALVGRVAAIGEAAERARAGVFAARTPLSIVSALPEAVRAALAADGDRVMEALGAISVVNLEAARRGSDAADGDADAAA